MAQFDAIFFDMDGTLVDNSSLMPEAFRQAFAKLGYTIEIKPWRGSGCTDYEVMDKYLVDYPLKDEEKDELKEKIAAEVRKTVIDKVRETTLHALPGVPELIRELNQRDIRPGLLTGNLEAIVGPKLESAGLRREDFWYGGFGDHSSNRPETARRALASASAFFGREIDPARALVIGDTPNDISCARAINAKVLAVASGHFTMDQLAEHAPDYLFRDLSDMQAFLDMIGISPNS